MEEQKEAYGLVYKSRPPYEVLYTKWLTYEDVLTLKSVEEMVEVYYNSGQFSYTLKQLEKEFDSPFSLYLALGKYYENHELHLMNHARITRYEILLGFIQSLETGKEEMYRELLTFDLYLRENMKTRPAFAGEYLVEKEILSDFYEKEAEEHNFLEGYESYDKRQLRKMTHMEKFHYDVMGDGAPMEQMILFDYQNRSKLTHQSKTFIIKR